MMCTLISKKKVFVNILLRSFGNSWYASKRLLLLLYLPILPLFAFTQQNHSLEGTVVNEYNTPMTGATVFLEPAKEGAATGDQGQFSFRSLSEGTYIIAVSFIGYDILTDTIQVSGKTTYHAQLKESAVSLQEVIITHHYEESRRKEEALSIKIINDRFLKQNLGGSLMHSLERLPGVTAMDIGSGQSKPVIRGLGFNRVVVVENGIKHEAQQWGADHGLEIDQYAVDHVEVIKGPGAIMYGSDAIGGVIDLQNRNIPINNTIGGAIDLTGKTNNDFLGTSISLNARKDRFFANLRVTILDFADYRVPTDSIDIYSYRAPLHQNHLRNTAGTEKNVHASFGILDENFHSRFYMSSVNIKSGFFANAHGLEPRNVNSELHDRSNRDILFPYQSANHIKLINSSQYIWEQFTLSFNGGIQRNLRQEFSPYVDHGFMPFSFPDTMSFDSALERLFEKHIYSGNLKISYYPSKGTHFSFGVNSEYQQNRIDGRGFIIPAYNQLTFGIFTFARHATSDHSNIQAGRNWPPMA